MMKWGALALAFALPAVTAQSISRVGNLAFVEVGNDEAVVRAPRTYPVVEEFSHSDGLESVRLLQPGWSPKVILGMDFAHRFADSQLLTADRTGIRNFFVDNHWQEATAPEDCADAYISEQSSTRSLVIVWGVGKGFVFSGQQQAGIVQSLQFMLDSLDLTEGACAWER